MLLNVVPSPFLEDLGGRSSSNRADLRFLVMGSQRREQTKRSGMEIITRMKRTTAAEQEGQG
jgi:hypothetical protein